MSTSADTYWSKRFHDELVKIDDESSRKATSMARKLSLQIWLEPDEVEIALSRVVLPVVLELLLVGACVVDW